MKKAGNILKSILYKKLQTLDIKFLAKLEIGEQRAHSDLRLNDL